jgi:serine/threonine protein kinase
MDPWWTVIVMEYIHDAKEFTPTESSVKQLRDAVLCMHDNGYVHGDLRTCNILQSVDDKKVVIIDFDWAGHVSSNPKYPMAMNHAEIKWPDGVEALATITAAHDAHWFSKLTGQPLRKQTRKKRTR